jgi:hypothetical protein
MKLTISIICVILAILSLNAQSNNTKDSILKAFEHKIAKDWKVEIHKDTLVIESKTEMWIDFQNIAGMSTIGIQHEKYTLEYLKKNGIKTKARIMFVIQPKWNSTKIEHIQNENSRIYNEIDSLLSKYSLTHLNRTYRWHEELFGGETTKEENKRILLYKAEKEKLLQTITKPPNYETENHYLFIISRNWRYRETNTAYMRPMIFPDSQKNAIWALESRMEDSLKSITKRN